MYKNAIMTATEQLLVSVPELLKQLDNYGITSDVLTFKYVVSNGKKDGSLYTTTKVADCNFDNKEVLNIASKMVMVRHIEVTCVCYTDYTTDFLTIIVTDSYSPNEFRVTCNFERFTAVFLSNRDIERKIKNEEPAEAPVDRVSYSGSINFLSRTLYPLNKGGMTTIRSSYLYPTYYKALEEQKYLMDKYAELLEVLEHSNPSDVDKFDVCHMQKCIESIPNDTKNPEHKKELLGACELDVDTHNFKNPDLIDKFFCEYQRQLKVRCDEFKRVMGFSIEDEVRAKNNSWYENALLELADAINK